MVIIAIVILLTVFIYGILEMNRSSKNISKEKIRGLTTADKNAAVGIVKRYWRVCMILLAIIIGFIFITLTSKSPCKVTSDDFSHLSRIA